MSALFVADDSGYKLADEQTVFASAAELAAEKLKPGMVIRGPSDVRQLLPALLGGKQNEAFCVAWMDTHGKLIKFEQLYQGSLDEARVYPREVVKRGLELNAARMFIVHNHPSGSPEPSDADIRLTLCIRLAASLFDITLVDHFLVAADQVVSLEQRRLIDAKAMTDFVLETVGPREAPDFAQMFGRLLLGGRS